MSRPKSKIAEYFPHFAKGGRTIYILESKYGNDGYAFWFKVLELLCDTEGQVYDCKNPANWEFLTAKTRVTSEQAKEILATLASLEAIDPELWNQRQVIWVQNLVNNLSPLYSRRSSSSPQRPDLECDRSKKTEETDYCEQKPDVNGQNDDKNPQSKVKESKEEKSKDSTAKTTRFDCERIVELWNEIIKKPAVAKLTDDRRKKVKARIEEWKAKTQEDAEAKAREIFTRISESDFLSGRTGNWNATFDWLFSNDKNWLKVMEGNYDNRTSHKPNKAQNCGDSRLGAGEYITEDGRRTYGTGKATIPAYAPPRPSERYSWDAGSENWILQ